MTTPRFGNDLEKYKARFDDGTGVPHPELRGDRFVLIDSTIQITPRNTTYLFGVLKDRVTKVVQVAS